MGMGQTAIVIISIFLGLLFGGLLREAWDLSLLASAPISGAIAAATGWLALQITRKDE
jgi:hypothetical protein